jgi:hypothetical protein
MVIGEPVKNYNRYFIKIISNMHDSMDVDFEIRLLIPNLEMVTGLCSNISVETRFIIRNLRHRNACISFN